MTTDTQHSLDALCTLADLPKRTVRYYMQQGLVPKPHGEKRGAWYDQQHLERLLQIKQWQSAGLSLTRIGELLAEPDPTAPPAPPRRPGDVEVWSRIHLNHGLELAVEPGKAGLTPEQVRALVQGVTDLYQQVVQDAAKEHKA